MFANLCPCVQKLSLTWLMAVLLCTSVALAQTASQPAPIWQMQDSGTTAGLRGIDSVDGRVAWASGTGGTVLRTVDGGAHWSKCAVPDGDKDGATLDFRGVQAWDATTAIVMASGPGEKSRLYKTTDGCGSWKLVFRNPDKDGFWDAIEITGAKTALMIGDPLPKTQLDRFKVKQLFHFPLYGTIDAGEKWLRLDTNNLFARRDEKGKSSESIFAASNSSLLELRNHRLILFAKGGSTAGLGLLESIGRPDPLLCTSPCSVSGVSKVPLKFGPTAGVFSVSARNPDSEDPILVAVGGDYANPEDREGTSATCWRDTDLPVVFTFFCEASTKPPHGYRSTVQWSETEKAWFTAGTNGSDISRDDGRTWHPLDNGNWNALSLPFIVGTNGRIGKLNPSVLPRN